jgi:hypothetical protein
MGRSRLRGNYLQLRQLRRPRIDRLIEPVEDLVGIRIVPIPSPSFHELLVRRHVGIVIGTEIIVSVRGRGIRIMRR